MNCSACGTENADGSRFCQQCGNRLGEQLHGGKVCDRCGAQNADHTRFCTSCGQSFEAAEELQVQRAVLVTVEKDGTDGQVYPLDTGTLDIGRTEGDLVFGDDRYMSNRHARVERRGGDFVVRDLDSHNGLYARLRTPHKLADGDMMLLGQQVLRFEVLPETEVPLGPASTGGVWIFGTPETPRFGRLIQYTTEGVGRNTYYLHRDETVLGREVGDIVFTEDPFLSRKHASITVDRVAKQYILRDLGSSNGTAIRFRGERVLQTGDYLRVGRHLFRFDVGGGG